jgi:hypothetical protein
VSLRVWGIRGAVVKNRVPSHALQSNMEHDSAFCVAGSDKGKQHKSEAAAFCVGQGMSSCMAQMLHSSGF